MQSRSIPWAFLGALFLALVLGYLAGRMVTLLSFQSSPAVERTDERPAVPVLHIDGRQGETLRGRASGELRIEIGTQVIPAKDSEITIPLAGLKNVVTVTVPAGMKYVASKNGKYYYPVESVAGEKIVPANRVYFASEGDAEAAGFAAGR